MGTPAIERDNEVTQLFERIQELNRDRGARSHVAGNINQPLVKSAAMGASAPTTPPIQLTQDEQKRRDQLAAEYLGVSVPEQERLASSQNFQSEAPSNFGAFHQPTDRRRGLPDLHKIEGVSFLTNSVIVDGMEFPIPESDLSDIKGYLLQVVIDAFTKEVASALSSLGLITVESVGGQSDKALLKMSEGDPQGQSRPVRAVRERKKKEVATSESTAGSGVSSEDQTEGSRDSSKTTELPRVQPRRRGRPRKATKE